MRSLFAKIVGWFIVSVVITLAATIFISSVGYNPYSSSRPTPLSMLLSLEMVEARHAYETGGPPALAESLARFQRVSHATEAIFTDANGTDVLTGQKHEALVRAAHAWTHWPFSGAHGTTFARFSGDGEYCLLVETERSYLLGNLQPAHLLVLALAILLCYALAYNLTAPLRRLQKALDRFGRGDLAARAEESRKDELGDLARAFDRMADRIQTLVAAERRLLLDISHELRSPLARLSVAVELARAGGNALPLDRIQKEADRLNALISQMLEVTRAEGDSANRRQELVKMDALVAGLVDACSIEARARGCALVLLASDAGATVEGDSELLRRAIENVVRNAIRHAPSGSRIEMAMERAGDRIRIRLRDYGPGVPEKALPHLFEPFYRVEPDRNRGSGGVGLGLSIALRAVQVHQGTLKASNADPGLLVVIDLPAYRPVEETKVREREAGAVSAEPRG